MNDVPRTTFATLPTPLVAAPRLSEAVGIEVWIKRDDLTGLLLGGNKARKLEFLCGEAQAQGCDTLVTGGGSGSNHVQLTAAAAARLDLRCTVVCYGDPPPPDAEPLGLRLARRLGAEIAFTGSPERASVDAALDEMAAKLSADGRRPYVIPRGGASATGAVGYAVAALELAAQLAAANLGSDGPTAPDPTAPGPTAPGAASAGLTAATVLLATGSCGTQAGLIAGAALLDRLSSQPHVAAVDLRVVGVPVSRPPEECTDRIVELATGCAARLGFDRAFTAADVNLLGGYIGPGYGKISPGGDEAAALAARTEGLLLDPVFTAKAMGALVAEARSGRLTGPVVFLHTGGTPAALAALP